MNQLTVKQVANVSGITIRTFHYYYDQIGLFEPVKKGDSGYRY